MADTYVDLSFANIFSLFQCNENKGCEGHLLLLRIPDATLEYEAGNKGRVIRVFPFCNQSPVGSVGQGRAESLPSVSLGGPLSSVFIQQMLLVL